MMYYYGNSFGLWPFHSFFGGILMILFWVLVATVIVWAIRGGQHQHRRYGTYGDSRALDILKERYAKGEIDKEEYDLRKRDLEG